MKKIELNEEHLKSLEAFINTIPTAYGLPLLKFLGELNEAQNGQQSDSKKQREKDNDARMDGVLAHELQEVLPYAVHGEKDAKEMQSVDYSKIVPILVKAIQELKAEIDELKAK